MRMRGLLIAMFLGCSGGAQPQAMTPVSGTSDPDPSTTEPAAGANVIGAMPTCHTNADCADGGVCEGKGCGDDTWGTCAPATRGCTRDLRAYCGCDGQTFRASGSCPGRRFASEGACPGSAP